jgi:hypothetical protein
MAFTIPLASLTTRAEGDRTKEAQHINPIHTMRQELTIRDIERCFSTRWFNLHEAWTHLFSLYGAEAFGGRIMKEDSMRRILENLKKDGFLEKAGKLGQFTRKYRIVQRARATARKPSARTKKPKPLRPLRQLLDEYEKALDRSVRQEGHDSLIIDDPERKAQWMYYIRTNKATQKRLRKKPEGRRSKSAI